MSLLIKGMKMPKYCAECDAVDREELLCPFTNDDCEDYFSVRNRNCPLVPVPPHGRCIDADKINYAQSENGCLDDYAYRYDINEMPTIIQAEEETE